MITEIGHVCLKAVIGAESGKDGPRTAVIQGASCAIQAHEEVHHKGTGVLYDASGWTHHTIRVRKGTFRQVIHIRSHRVAPRKQTVLAIKFVGLNLFNPNRVSRPLDGRWLAAFGTGTAIGEPAFYGGLLEIVTTGRHRSVRDGHGFHGDGTGETFGLRAAEKGGYDVGR